MEKSFTLLELIIAVIIIGILVGIALPKFINVAEKAKSAEAVNILGAIRSAQFRYYAQYGDYYSTGGNCMALDTEVQTPRYFFPPVCVKAVYGPDSITVAHMDKRDGMYYLEIYENGEFRCSNPPVCMSLGF